MKLKLFFMFLLLVQVSYAASEYRPYLHEAVVPEHPDVKLFGQYSTNLFPGAATYSYGIEVPKGVNGLQPLISLSYNSQSNDKWTFTSSYIYRDRNSTISDESDDEFILILEGVAYELRYDGNFWHTEVESYFKVENYSNHWVLTKKNGKKYTFGNNSLISNHRWYVDQVTDLHGNNIYYNYFLDNGTLKILNVKYNNDQTREIKFNYEEKPRQRVVYDNGLIVHETKRVKDISVFAPSLVRRYSFSYTQLSPFISSLSLIKYFGSDNSSILHNISFDYYISNLDIENSTEDWDAPESFTNVNNYDFGVRLVDFNHDGYVDMVQGNQDTETKNVWINNKTKGWVNLSTWNVPEYFVHTDKTDQGVRLMDINNDGFVDTIKARDGDRVVYLNNKTGWNLSSWVMPLDILNSVAEDMGIRFGDVNGDGFIDFIRAKGGSRNVYLNNRTGWVDSWNNFPADFTTAAGKDSGLRLLDVNGDGLPDLTKSTPTSSNTWLNNGSGWESYSKFISPVAFITSEDKDNGIRFLDLNKDGLIDFWEGHDTTLKAYINNGTGWIENNTWAPREALLYNNENTGRRLADVNGDGFVDVIISHDNIGKYTYLRNFTLPYLLKSITNEYGGKVVINYSTSTSFNNSENGFSELGFNLFVVTNVTMNGSVSYNYSFGKYNYNKNEFRGFGKSVEIKPGKVIKHYFYQDDPRKGKEFKTEVFGNSLLSKNVKDYNYTYNGVYNVSLIFSSDYIYDGLEVPKVTNKTYVYDSFHNLISLKDLGDINIEGDEHYTNYTYSTKNWILDRIASVTEFDSDNNKVKQTKYFYDNLGLNALGSFGDLTKVEKWSSNSSFNYFVYDNFGNLIREIDSLGGSTKYGYGLYNTYLAYSVNPLGHITSFGYDLGTGNLIFQESNGINTSFEYDVFGRILKEIKPYDSLLLPTKNYTYVFDGTVPELVKVSSRTTSNKSDSISYYYDGYGNLIQIKTDVDSRQIVKNIFYDSEFRVFSEQNPYFSAKTENLSSISNDARTYYTYDALDRVIGVLNSDSTSKNVTFLQYNITDFDENSNKHIYTLDGRGRISKVYEFNLGETYVTFYTYDGNDNLVLIVDNEGNEFSFTYDSLNRKVRMNDPDLGEWNYYYDVNGNLVRQEDAKNNTITLNYDLLNRILHKNSSNVNITFNYDKDYLGTLSNLTMGDIVFKYEYDDRLRLVKQIQNLEGVEVTNEYLYDSQDRLISENSLDYIYNYQGLVSSIPGYIDSSFYSAFGTMLNRSYNNGLLQTFSYIDDNNRLKLININNVQNLNYTYDNVGNILKIVDSNKNHILTYDGLDRLVTATIGSDNYRYAYNSIGNIMNLVSNNNAKKFIYSSGHAPVKILENVSSVDLYNPKDTNSGNKTRTFKFNLTQDTNINSTANWTVYFGDGSSSSGSTTDSLVTVQHTYANGGTYDVGFVTDYDEQNLSLTFGARAESLTLVSSNTSTRLFELKITNDMLENALNVGWNCSLGLSSTSLVNLSSEMYVNITANFTTPGNKLFNCTVTSDDGSESITLPLEVKGLEVKEYDVLLENKSKRIVSYNLVNHFSTLNTNLSHNIEGFSTTVNVSDDVMVFAEVNYTSDGHNEFIITSNYSTGYVDSFTKVGVSIENFSRVNNIINMMLYNYWYPGTIYFNISEVDNSTTENILKYNKEVSKDRVEVSAFTSSYVDKLISVYLGNPFQVSLLTLHEGEIVVNELIVDNDQGQLIDWQFNTGVENVFSTNSVNDSVMVFIESNYSIDGVYKTVATVNSSSNSNNVTGVVVK